MVVVMRMEPVMSMPEVWHAHAHRVILVTDIDVWDPATKITEVVTSWLCAKKGYLMTLKYYFYAFISFIDASMKWRNLAKTLSIWRKTPKNPSINQSINQSIRSKAKSSVHLIMHSWYSNSMTNFLLVRCLAFWNGHYSSKFIS